MLKNFISVQELHEKQKIKKSIKENHNESDKEKTLKIKTRHFHFKNRYSFVQYIEVL